MLDVLLLLVTNDTEVRFTVLTELDVDDRILTFVLRQRLGICWAVSRRCYHCDSDQILLILLSAHICDWEIVS